MRLIAACEVQARLAHEGHGDLLRLHKLYNELETSIDRVSNLSVSDNVDRSALIGELESHRQKIGEWTKIYERAYVTRFPLVRALPQFTRDTAEFHLLGHHERAAIRQAFDRLREEIGAATKENPLSHHARVILLPVTFDHAGDAQPSPIRELVRRELIRCFSHLSPMANDFPQSDRGRGEPQGSNAWGHRLGQLHFQGKFNSDEKQLDVIFRKWPQLRTKDEILLVDVWRTSLHGGRDTAFTAEGRLYRNGNFSKPASTRVGVGVARKQGDILPASAAWLALCFTTAVVLSMVAKRRKRLGFRFQGRRLLGASLAFLLGSATAWGVVLLLGRAAPDHVREALRGLWWPCLLGVLLLFVPALAWSLIRVKSFAKVLPCPFDGWTGASVGLGVSAAIGLPILSWNPTSGWLALTAVSTAAAQISALVGFGIQSRSVRRPLLLACAFTLAGVWGLGLGMLHIGLLLSTIAAATTIIAVTRCSKNDDMTRDESATVASTPDELPFQPPAGFDRLVQRVERAWRDEQTCWVRVSGPTDCGKTTTSQTLVENLLAENRGQVRVLRVTCQADDSPLEPFLRTAGDGACDLLPDAAEFRFFNSTLEVLATFAPTLDELVGAGPKEKSPADWIALVESELSGICDTGRLILVVDDAQWMDESSSELLRRFRTRFRDRRGPLVIVSGVEVSLPTEFFDDNIELDSPTDDHLTAILVKGLRFDERSARRIIETIDAGTSANQRGRNLTWLKRTVDHLSELGATFEQDGQYYLAPKYLSGQLPPAPRGLNELVCEQVEQFSQHRLLLQAAACIGRAFDVNALCGCLRRDRLSVLEVLGEITRGSDLLTDLNTTGRFAFASTQTYQSVCTAIGVTAGLPDEPVSQLQSELHARIAENLHANSEQNVFDLARQCALAGGRFAEQGIRYCQQAAGVAAATYAFEQAHVYLGWADRCAKMCGQPFDMRLQQLLLDCERAYVTGEKQLLCGAADQAIIASSQYDEPSILITFARASYGAQKMTEGDRSRHYAAQTVRIGMQVAELDTATPAQRAAGFHFVALGQSPSQASRIRLRQARALLLGSQTVAELVTLSHIECSLANELLRGEDMLPDEAKHLFEHSLMLHQEHKPNDMAGIARLHGGLGRIALYIDRDAATAEFHAQQNLNYCRQLGDRRGMAQMYSLLGDCALATGNQAMAASYFKQCEQYAQSRTDQFFAVVGLLRSAHGTTEEMHLYGERLLGLLRGDSGPAVTVPPFAKPHLAEALRISRQRSQSEWANEIEANFGGNLLQPRRVPRRSAA